MFNRTNEDLIKELVDLGYLKNERIVEAFKEVDRKNFVLEEYKDRAYINEPLSIGFEQTISQPLTVAFMLELLDLRAGDYVLEIGSGSGWLTSLIAYLISNQLISTDKEDKPINTDKKISENQSVVAIERMPELKEFSEKNISKYFNIGENQDSNQSKSVSVLTVLGDGSKGYPQKAPYDKIIASAAGDEIPKEWKDQLKIGGRIVVPIKNSVLVLDKTEKNEFETKEFWGFSFVKLVKD